MPISPGRRKGFASTSRCAAAAAAALAHPGTGQARRYPSRGCGCLPPSQPTEADRGVVQAVLLSCHTAAEHECCCWALTMLTCGIAGTTGIASTGGGGRGALGYARKCCSCWHARRDVPDPGAGSGAGRVPDPLPRGRNHHHAAGECSNSSVT
jgi:hypothetical protein